MIDTDVMQGYIRDANPIPTLDDLDPDELTTFVTAARTRRAALMQAPTQHPTPITSATPPPQRRRKAWAFAAGFVVILLVVGAAALFLRGDDTRVADEPAPTTTLQEEPEAAINVDSLSWTRITLGAEGPSLAITEGGPGLIGLGFISEPDPDDLTDGGGGPGWVQGYNETPTVWTSADGYEWSRVSDQEVFDTDSVKTADIAAGESGVVAVVEHHAWFSPDGVSWSRVPDGSFTENADWLTGVIAGGPGFVAFGDDESTGHAAVWTSPDGLAWTRVPDDPAVFNATMESMTVGGPGLVAVGYDETTSNPVIWTSPDGYTWTLVPHDPASFGEGNPQQMFSGMRINDVAAGETGLVAVGYDMTELTPEELKVMAAVWTSSDGVTWTRVPHDPALFEGPPYWPEGEVTGVAAVGDGFIAIGRIGGGAQVWTSPDGTSWTRYTDLPEVTDTDGMRQVIAAGNGVIILGIEGQGPYVAQDRPGGWSSSMQIVLWIGSPAQPTE